MNWFTHFVVGRLCSLQLWCVQPRLHFYLFNTTPTLNRLSNLCTNVQKQIKTVVPRSSITQETHSDKNVTERAISDDRVEGTVTKQNDGIKDTAKIKIHSERQLNQLAKLLHCSIDDMQTLVQKYSFFTHLSPELIRVKVSVMLFYGLPYSFISANPRLLYQTSATELQRRLQKFQDHSFLSENSVLTLDSLGHYLECKNNMFDWVFKRLCAERDALEGCYDQVAYLQLRLNITNAQALQILDSYPFERNISNTKLKEVLDFFLNETNLGAEFFIKHRKLSMFSLLRLRTRWNVIVSEGITSEAKMVFIWNMSEKAFDSMYNNDNIL